MWNVFEIHKYSHWFVRLHSLSHFQRRILRRRYLFLAFVRAWNNHLFLNVILHRKWLKAEPKGQWLYLCILIKDNLWKNSHTINVLLRLTVITLFITIFFDRLFIYESLNNYIYPSFKKLIVIFLSNLAAVLFNT